MTGKKFETSTTNTSGVIDINVSKRGKYGYQVMNTKDVLQIICVHIHST